MRRRDFLKFLGLIPLAPKLLDVADVEEVSDNVYFLPEHIKDFDNYEMGVGNNSLWLISKDPIERNKLVYWDGTGVRKHEP